MKLDLRRAAPHDFAMIRVLVRAAFHDNEPTETVTFLDDLRIDNCVLGEWIVERNGQPIAHVAFSRVRIQTDEGKNISAAMLTPLSVSPDHQGSGVGTKLTMYSLSELEREGETIFLVLGHPDYYPRFGFRADLAANIESPWGNTPAFMARSENIAKGRLILPRSIAAAH